jgi:dihydrofolate reductase
VISRQAKLSLPAGVLLAASVPDALALAREIAARDGVQACMVIGGADVYRQSLPFADRIHLTLIERDYAGDTLFPECAAADWREVARESGVSVADPALGFSFLTLERVGMPAGLPET